MLSAARVIAGPFPRHPRRMLADPLRDIGLGRHHALLDRTVPGKLNRLLLTIAGIGNGTNGQDDFNQTVLHSKHGSAILRPKSPLRFKPERKLYLCRIATSAIGSSTERSVRPAVLDIERKRVIFKTHTCQGLAPDLTLQTRDAVNTLLCRTNSLVNAQLANRTRDFQDPKTAQAQEEETLRGRNGK